MIALYHAETRRLEKLKVGAYNDNDGNHPINQMPRNLSDRNIRRQLDALLTLRQQLDKNSPAEFFAAFMIVRGALSLCRELVRPAAPLYGIGIDFECFDDLSREEMRAMAARAIREGFPLPESIADVIAMGLEGLNSGGVSWIVSPTPGRRGQAPHAFDYAKLRLCLWIRYQHAMGRTIREAQEEVCEQIGHSYEAVSRWPREMIRLHGEKRMDKLFKAAARLGEVKMVSPMSTANEMGVFIEVRGMLRYGLEDILNDYRLAVRSDSS